MRRFHAFAAALMLSAAVIVPAQAGPLDIVRDAAELGLETAERAVDLGLDTAEEAANIAEDAITPDPPPPSTEAQHADPRLPEPRPETADASEHECHRGERYIGNNGDWQVCPS